MKPTPIALFLVVGCGPAVAVDASDTTTTSDDDESESTPDPSVDPDPSTTITTVDPTDATDEGIDESTDADSEGEGSVFIPTPDVSETFECDLWIDDCPRGFKCMPWANDGGNSWNATKCTPLSEDPNGVGEPCTVEESGVSGVDDCEARAMCWYVDETNMGTCVAMCSGSEANPTCDDPCTTCPISNEGLLILCLPTCDPLQQNCPEGQGCYAVNQSFVCAPDSGAEMGALGDPCEFVNVCDPGLFCANADSVPDCAGATGCCASFCDALAEDPCASMPGGVECIPFFDDGEAPPCGSGVVGGCLLPE